MFYNEQLIGYELRQLIWKGRSENEHINAVHLHSGGNICSDFPFFCGSERHADSGKQSESRMKVPGKFASRLDITPGAVGGLY